MSKQQIGLDELFPKKNPTPEVNKELNIDSLFPKKKDVTVSSGKISSTVGKSESYNVNLPEKQNEDDESWWDSFKGAASSIINVLSPAAKKIIPNTIAGGVSLVTHLATGVIKGSVSKEEAEGDLKPVIDFLEAPSNYIQDQVSVLNKVYDKQILEAKKDAGIKEEYVNENISKVLEKDFGQGIRKLGLASVEAIPNLVGLALAGGGSKLKTFGAGYATSVTQNLQEEYEQDKNISGIDFAQANLKAGIDGLTEMIFDTDLKAISSTGKAFLKGLTPNPIKESIKQTIKTEGKAAAKEIIARNYYDVIKGAFKGIKEESLEEGIANVASFAVDAIDADKLDSKDYEQMIYNTVDAMMIGGAVGGTVSGLSGILTKKPLTEEQNHLISKYNEVAKDNTLSEDIRNSAKEKIDTINKYNEDENDSNYKLVAELPLEKRVEAFGVLSKIQRIESEKKSLKDLDLIKSADEKIESYQNEVNQIIDEEYKSQVESRRKASMSQSDIDTEAIVNMFQSSEKNGISIEDMDSAINDIRNKVNNNEELSQEDAELATNTLYDIIDEIDKSDLTAEQKKIASESFFNQIEGLQSYDKIVKTTEVTTPITEVTTTTRETARKERPKTSVTTDRFNLEPVQVTDKEGNKLNFVARVDENGSINLVPKVKFNRSAAQEKRSPIEIDSNLLQFQESIKDENDRVIGAKLLDRKTGNILEISNPELAIDLATRAKQETLGNVSEGVMEKETTVKPIGFMNSVVKEFVNKKTQVQESQVPQEIAQDEEIPVLTTELPTSPVGLPSRRAYVVEDDVEIKKGNRILNKITPEIKKRIGNYVKALKATVPNSTVILYDNKADMIEGLVNQGYSREQVTSAVNESDGLFAGETNTIHIDIMRMDKTTLPHEIFHPLVAKLANENPKEFIALRNRISKFLSKSNLKELNDFAKLYSAQKEEVQAEEFLAQLSALVTNNKAKMERGTLMELALAVKEFLKNIAAKTNSKSLANFANSIFTEQTKSDDLIKFFEGFGRSLRQGEEINTDVINVPADGFLAPEGNLRQQKITSVKNIDVKEVRTLSRAGNRVSKGLSVSTKNGKKVVQEAEDLSLEYVKTNAPDLFIANSNIIAKYPLVSGIVGDGKIETLDRAQEVYDVFSREVANNLEYLMDNFNQSYKDVSTLWYDGANILAQDLSKKYNVTTEQVAGIIASLSPQKDWYQNVRLAEMVLMAHEVNPVMSNEMVAKQKSIAQEGLKPSQKAFKKAEAEYKKSRTKANKEKLDTAKEKYESNLNNSNKIIDALSKLIGQKMNSVPNEMKGYYTRLYHEVNTTKDYDILSPDGQVMGIAVKNDGEKAKVAWGSYTEINKANAIYLDGSQENITRSLGEMHKIRNFYNNIIDPMSKDQDVTMDTHAIAAALLMPLSGTSKQVAENFGTGTKNSSPLGIKGLYYAYAEGYKLAAKENDLLPRQVQSITWEAIRGLFPATFKNSKENVSAIENIWNNYATNKISIDEARNKIDEFAGGIKDPTWARPIQEGGTENTQQGDVGRRADGVRQGLVGESTGDGLRQKKTYPDALEDSRKAYLAKFKNTPQELSRYVRKLLFERNINIKKAMQDANLEFSLYTMYNKAGASMFGNLKFTEKFNEIYGNLTPEEIKLVDNFVFLRRVVAIDSNFDNRNIERPKHTSHKDIDGVKITTNKESALATLSDYKDLLGQELYDKIYQSSDAYFKAFSDILKYKYDNGLINKETYELYKDYNYSPRKFLEFIFGTSISEEAELSSNNFYQRGLALSKEELSKIKDGSSEEILADSAKLLHAAMIAAEVRVASNLALKTLYEEAIPANLEFVKEVEYEKYKDGTIKVNEDGSLKYNKTPDNGFRIVTFKENGIVKAFQLKESLAKEYFDEELFDKNSKAYKVAQLATGANILRNMATGMNLAFPITNIPIDVISQVQLNNIYDGAGVGVAGQYTKALAGTISNSLKLIPLEWGFRNKELEDLIYEYGKAGGLMMSMSQEYAAKDKFFGAMAKYLGSFGNASEIGSKLTAYKATKEREIKLFTEKNGVAPTGEDLSKIQTKAAFIARSAMDYHRGGLLTKWLDGFIPYLNVFTQGSKITVDYIRNNPKAFSDKIIQTGLFITGLTIYNMMVAGSDYDNDDNEQDLATKIVIFMPFKNEDGTRGKIEIGTPAPVKSFLNIFQNMGEGIYYKIISQDEQRHNTWKAKVNAKFLNMFSTNLATNIPPALKALIEYSYNLDLWRGGKVYEKMGEVLPQDEGRYDKNVAEFYKIIGGATGMSPKRMQKSAENFITQSNPLVGIGYTIMDKMINQYQDIPESQRSKFDNGKISDIPVVLFDKIKGRIYSVTDPSVSFKKGNDIIDKISQEAGSKKMEVKAEMKLLIDKNASVNEMNAYIIKQDPIYRRVAKDYVTLVKKENLLKHPDNRDEYFDIMLGANSEAKAQIIYSYFPHLLMEGNEGLRHDLKMLNLYGEDTKRIFNQYHKNKGIPK